jgi:hypothetical protein
MDLIQVVGAALGCRRPSDGVSYCRGSSFGRRTVAALGVWAGGKRPYEDVISLEAR